MSEDLPMYNVELFTEIKRLQQENSSLKSRYDSAQFSQVLSEFYIEYLKHLLNKEGISYYDKPDSYLSAWV